MAKNGESKIKEIKYVTRLLERYFVESELVSDEELRETFARYAHRPPAVAAACTIKDLRGRIESYRRALLIRLLGNELSQYCANSNQKQDVNRIIKKAINLAKASMKPSAGK